MMETEGFSDAVYIRPGGVTYMKTVLLICMFVTVICLHVE
jgi:hypothetical protein